LKKATDFRELQVLSDVRRGMGEGSDPLKRASLLKIAIDLVSESLIQPARAA
jgi:hypothetical protein